MLLSINLIPRVACPSFRRRIYHKAMSGLLNGKDVGIVQLLLPAPPKPRLPRTFMWVVLVGALDAQRGVVLTSAEDTR